MKTMVRTEQVRFGTVTQCGKHWAFVQTENGAEVRLYWSHLRQVETVHGGIVFSTGRGPSIHKGDKVAFVPQQEGLWLWALRADYETALDFVKRNPVPSPVKPPLPVVPLPPPPPSLPPPPPPTPVINLEQEMVALGSAQLQKWQRRYGQKRAFA